MAPHSDQHAIMTIDQGLTGLVGVLLLLFLTLSHVIEGLLRLVLVVGLAYGVYAFLVQRKQVSQAQQQAQRQQEAAQAAALEAARRRTVEETRLMLVDVIRNQLTVVTMNAQLAIRDDEHRLTRIDNAVSVITDTLADLSYESLNAWKAKYHETVIATFKLQEGLDES